MNPFEIMARAGIKAEASAKAGEIWRELVLKLWKTETEEKLVKTPRKPPLKPAIIYRSKHGIAAWDLMGQPCFYIVEPELMDEIWERYKDDIYSCEGAEWLDFDRSFSAIFLNQGKVV